MLAGEALGMGEDGREAGGAGALGDDLLRLHQQLHRVLERVFLDQQDVAHQRAR